jgi:hypothetical protein
VLAWSDSDAFVQVSGLFGIQLHSLGPPRIGTSSLIRQKFC